GTCGGQGVCMPGTTQQVACGNCGTQTNTCTTTCAWATGSCGGQGACSPGSTRLGSCDACSQQTCTSSCTWGACALKPGNACAGRARSTGSHAPHAAGPERGGASRRRHGSHRWSRRLAGRRRTRLRGRPLDEIVGLLKGGREPAVCDDH